MTRLTRSALAAVLALVAFPLIAPEAALALVDGGQTTQGHPVVVQYARRTPLVTKLVLHWQANCSPSGLVYAETTVVRNLRVGRDLRFGGRFSETTPGTGPAATVFVSIDVHGRLSRRRSSGDWRGLIIARDAAGNTVDQCDSGTFTWVARP
jgi:hypothetical protein